MIIKWPLKGQFHNVLINVLTSPTGVRELGRYLIKMFTFLAKITKNDDKNDDDDDVLCGSFPKH